MQPEAGGTFTVSREIGKPRMTLLDDMIVERGTIEDWRVLEGLHYKQAGSLPAGSHHYRLSLHGETIGVLVMASPKLLLKERHVMFPMLKPGRDSKIVNTQRMKWLNANMQVVARVVVDTMYRGAGLAYRFTNLACRMEQKRFLEIQSSMSKYNMFAQRAGFDFVKPMRSNKFDKGVSFFRSTFRSDPADTEALLEELAAMRPEMRERLELETRTFYKKNSAMENTGRALMEEGMATRWLRMPIREIITKLQQMTLASPLYGVYTNPDLGADIPKVLPLSAFDEQAPNEPLKRSGPVKIMDRLGAMTKPVAHE